jgi:hypothetical protein
VGRARQKLPSAAGEAELIAALRPNKSKLYHISP